MQLKYILVTPAKNEESNIERTIKSILKQTHKPQKWIIVSDGSTDNTDAIVKKYSELNPFIDFIRNENKKKRDFSSKADIINSVFENIKEQKFDLFGNLDADIELPENYYEKICNIFFQNRDIGIAGGLILDVINWKQEKQFSKFENVGSAIQLFRKKCFEQINGYKKLSLGGEDTIAEVQARMHGWNVCVDETLFVKHHREMGTAQLSTLASRFRFGEQEYLYGSQPLFQIIKCVARMLERPYVIGGIYRLAGYIWAFLKGEKSTLDSKIIKQLRKEQLQKLKQKLF